MNSKEVYMNIYQVLSDRAQSYPMDFDRKLEVHVGRASAGNISHITLEFYGVRAKFFSCITFDGSGDHGCNLSGFAMPKMKLDIKPRAIVFLTLLEYLIDTGVLKANFEYFKECVAMEMNGGVGDLPSQYDRVCKNSRDYIKVKEMERTSVASAK